jgi:hypothetical protein
MRLLEEKYASLRTVLIHLDTYKDELGNIAYHGSGQRMM